MSTVMSSRTQARRCLNGGAYKVWEALQDLPAKCSLTDLEYETGLSRSAVVRAIRECETAGLISRSAECPRCGHDRAPDVCASCRTHEAPNYTYVLPSLPGSDSPLPEREMLPASIMPVPSQIVDTEVVSKRNHLGTSTIEPNTDSLKSLATPSAEEVCVYHERKQRQSYDDTRQKAVDGARLIGDKSLGVHIKAWATAKKHRLTKELIDIYAVSARQRQEKSYGQGKCFSFLWRQCLLERGLLAGGISEEQQQIRSSLSAHLEGMGV